MTCCWFLLLACRCLLFFLKTIKCRLTSLLGCSCYSRQLCLHRGLWDVEKLLLHEWMWGAPPKGRWLGAQGLGFKPKHCQPSSLWLSWTHCQTVAMAPQGLTWATQGILRLVTNDFPDKVLVKRTLSLEYDGEWARPDVLLFLCCTRC